MAQKKATPEVKQHVSKSGFLAENPIEMSVPTHFNHFILTSRFKFYGGRFPYLESICRVQVGLGCTKLYVGCSVLYPVRDTTTLQKEISYQQEKRRNDEKRCPFTVCEHSELNNYISLLTLIPGSQHNAVTVWKINKCMLTHSAVVNKVDTF